MEPGMTTLLYIDLVLVGLFTVLLAAVSSHRALQERRQRAERAEKVRREVKGIERRKDFTVASPQPSGA